MANAASLAPRTLSQYDRIVITGANGAGKTHVSGVIAGQRPVYHYDAMRLTTNWQKRSAEASLVDLRAAADGPRWIIEGGPSLLPHVLPSADLVIWLRPPLLTRAARLLRRSLRHHGQTRPELPPGNPDRFWPQMRFAAKSLWAEKRFANVIERALTEHPSVPVLRLSSIARADLMVP